MEACRKILLDAGVCTYLEDSEATINGIRIYGSPWYVCNEQVHTHACAPRCVHCKCMNDAQCKGALTDTDSELMSNNTTVNNTP